MKVETEDWDDPEIKEETEGLCSPGCATAPSRIG